MLNFIQEHLPAIAGIIIALLIISVGFIMWGKMSTSLDEAGGQLDSMTGRMANEAYTELDGRTDVSGATVITFCSDHKSDDKFIWVKGTQLKDIKINTSTGASGGYDPSAVSATSKAGALTSASKIIAAMKQKENAGNCYVNPSWTFTADVIYASDGTAEGIVFTRN